MAKKDEQAKASDGGAAQDEGLATPAPHPDAAGYVLQPTSEKLNVDVMGELPANRFQEEVPKSEAKGDAVDAHPPENQPAYGVTEEGQPDTSGRKRS